MSTFSFKMKSSLNQNVRNIPKMDLFSACSSFPPPDCVLKVSWPFLVTIYYLKSSSESREFLCKRHLKQTSCAKQTYHRPVETVPKQTAF